MGVVAAIFIIIVVVCIVAGYAQDNGDNWFR